MEMKRKCGFTLIELLVVIAIIAMLLAILTPSLQRVKDKAGFISCANNQRQIVTAVNGYMSEWDDSLPPAVSSSIGAPSILNSYNDKADPYISPAYTSLGSYLPTSKIFNCPISSFDTGGISTGAGTKSYQELYQNPNSINYDLSSSYQLLWNYQGYNNDKTADSKVKPFVGSWLGSGSDLLICEAMLFSTKSQPGGVSGFHWASPHRFGGSFRNGDDNYPYFYQKGQYEDIETDSGLKGIRLNAGYLDGSVTPYVAGDTYKYQPTKRHVTYLLPKSWQ